MKLLCIDPSIRACGYAVFEAWWPLSEGMRAVLRESGCYVNTTPEPWPGPLDSMVGATLDEAIRHDVDEVHIELPDHIRTEVNPEDVFKVLALVYSIRQACLDLYDVHLHPVKKWKGNVPKQVTQDRVRRHWGWKGDDHNEADAVGLGDYVLRKKRKVIPCKA